MTLPLPMKLEAAHEFAVRVQSHANEHALALGIIQALEEIQAESLTVEEGLMDASLEMQALIVVPETPEPAIYQQIGRYAGFLFVESDDYHNAKKQALREYVILCEMRDAGDIDGI